WSDDRTRQMVKAVFLNQGVFIAEVLRSMGRPRENMLDSIRMGDQDLDEAIRLHAEGKGLLVLTGHVGNYEFLASWAARHFPMTIIAKVVRPLSLNDFINDRRKQNGVNVLPPKKSYRAALHALKQKRCLGFIIDQNMKH